MRIDDREVRVHVALLTMPAEIEATVETIAHLVDGLEPGVTIHLLLNGGAAPDLPGRLDHPAVTVTQSPTNLGVAGGRNAQQETAEARAADLTIFLDNDVIPPADYVRRMAEAVVRHPGLGAVGAPILDYPVLRQRHPGLFAPSAGPFGATLHRVTCDALRAAVDGDRAAELFFHLGSNPDWEGFYFERRQDLEMLEVLAGRRPHLSTPAGLQQIPEVIALVGQDPPRLLPTTTVAGGSMAIARDVWDRHGPFDDLFNPYGYEDVELSIRLRRSGLTNVYALGACLIHGTNPEHVSSKRSLKGQPRYLTHMGRVWTILYFLHAPEHFRWMTVRRMMLEAWIRTGLNDVSGARDILYYFTKGHRQALGQLADSGRPIPPQRKGLPATMTEAHPIDAFLDRVHDELMAATGRFEADAMREAMIDERNARIEDLNGALAARERQLADLTVQAQEALEAVRKDYEFKIAKLTMRLDRLQAAETAEKEPGR